mgnify:CR=1 FL=1
MYHWAPIYLRSCALCGADTSPTPERRWSRAAPPAATLATGF